VTEREKSAGKETIPEQINRCRLSYPRSDAYAPPGMCTNVLFQLSNSSNGSVPPYSALSPASAEYFVRFRPPSIPAIA
jgi:hypothetical protein